MEDSAGVDVGLGGGPVLITTGSPASRAGRLSNIIITRATRRASSPTKNLVFLAIFPLLSRIQSCRCAFGQLNYTTVSEDYWFRVRFKNKGGISASKQTTAP